MQIYGDYHTHTIYSKHNHGKGTIMQNAIMAQQKGLKEIAISDHGFSHKMYGVDRKNLEIIKKEIEIAKKQTGVNILLGVEENIISADGDIGIIPSDLDYLDILLVGYHKLAKPKTLKDKFDVFYSNSLNPFAPSKARIEKNTLTMLKLLDKYPVNIITHMGVGFPVDCKAVGKYASQKNTFVELNGKRIAFTKEDIDFMIAEKVKFILDSDAHRPEKVGNVTKPMSYVLRYNIPEELIVNLDKKPNFKSIK